ncbi:sensor histidine kinase [Massilia glaciei]|uniref:histidine kinase n=1 Tax=Massilia glaciei TaxID=1524097 RepID=A0A2U2I4W7_9BURK|nr:HAMP domain-containing sensor histidine kinase [Massilia glaciei]PWF54645.1 sensor histidine kinase [Massilia glaciei]
MRPRSQSSLFRRLLLGFSAVIIALALLALAHMLYEAKINQQAHTASENKAAARQILFSIERVADQPDEIRRAAAGLERVRTDMFNELEYRSQVRLRIWRGGQLIYNSAPALPDVLPAPGSAAARGANAWVSWRAHDGASGLVVERSHEVDDEWMLTFSGASFLLWPTAFSLPFLLIPAWIITRYGLSPLRSIAAAIEQRSVSDLSALPDSQYSELSPLVEAINRLMARLNERIERDHELLTDAAHELKTPLAVIQINAHLLLSRCGGIPGVEEASAGLRGGLARVTHTVHQLLAFERMRAESIEEALPLQDLRALLCDRLAAAAPLALRRAIDIELAPGAECVMPLHRESMAAMLDNLISNAVKYSPDGGKVAVCLDADPQGCRLSITDQGPGIAPHLRHKVFERFYRIPGQDIDGSGLGLAIVERAVARNNGTLRLDAGAEGTGLAVHVAFPA